ncbi:MAG: hypothetical protein V4722_08670 [Bacteroidota bacterium]
MHDKKNLPKLSIVSWYEDSVSMYQFALLDKKQFAYTIVNKHVPDHIIETYYGDWALLKDTIFLTFKKNDPKPKGLYHYLIVEGSDTYLIQTFTNSPTKLFLRIHKNLRHSF